MRSIQRILKLLGKKYPYNESEEINAALFIYDDGSGRIVKDVQEYVYERGNTLFSFLDIEELVKHLEEK